MQTDLILFAPVHGTAGGCHTPDTGLENGSVGHCNMDPPLCIQLQITTLIEKKFQPELSTAMQEDASLAVTKAKLSR